MAAAAIAPKIAPRIHEAPDDLLAAIDFCYEQGWTDGLPVVPPVVDRVKAMLAVEARPPETVIAHHPATGLDLSLHAAAVNAVMAGCLPEYFPVVVAAFEAMDKEPFNFHGSTASTGGSAPLLIVSGPVTDEIGMNADVNLFGPGNRANATIGRATRLILRNVFQMLPGISDKSTQGNPGKYSFCIAERSRGNPWPPLCEAQGYPKGTSSVTCYAGGGFCNVENHGGNTPEQILSSVAD
ncbi:MAG: TlpA family protein disulfide reductase, partial [Alphaproteobacteria bacterium]|nr:TlpA family protein disulfide reductase [Alphaproteobacteria bacterium]